MEVIIVFCYFLDQFSQLLVLPVKLDLYLVQLNKLLTSLRLQLFHLRVLTADLYRSLFDTLL